MDREEQIFRAVERIYGAHPAFAASSQPIRDLIRWLLAAGPRLVPILRLFVAMFPALAPVADAIPAIIALFQPAPTPTAPNPTQLP